MCIDVFTKYVVFVPLVGKTEGDLSHGILECFAKMGHKPKVLYMDAEPTIVRSKIIQDYFDKEKITFIPTRTHPNFVERMNRTFREMLYKRIKEDQNKGKENIQWTDYIYPILLTYDNKMKHSAIFMTPNKARKP